MRSQDEIQSILEGKVQGYMNCDFLVRGKGHFRELKAMFGKRNIKDVEVRGTSDTSGDLQVQGFFWIQTRSQQQSKAGRND